MRLSTTWHSALFVLPLFALARPAAANDISAAEYQRQTVYHSPQKPGYTCWVGAWIMPDGDLMTCFTQATGPAKGRPQAPKDVQEKLTWPPKGSPGYDMTGLDLKNVHLRSSDAGKTWTQVSADPFKSCMNGVTGEAQTALADGTVIRGVFGFYLPYDRDVPQTGFLQRSSDGTRTWGKPESFLHPDKYTTWPRRIRVLRDGRIVLLMGVAPFPAGSQTRAQFSKVIQPMMVVSADNGKTWTGPIAAVPKDQPDGWTEEYDIAELAGGDLLAVFRRASDAKRWQSVLKKSAKTWEAGKAAPSVLPHSGQPELLATKEGPVLHVATSGVHWTDDSGKSWHKLDVPGTAYYPRSVQAKDGTIFIFGHIGGDNAYGSVDQSIVMDSFKLVKQPFKHPANPVLTPSPKGWDALNVLHCAVVRDEQGYKMYYTGEEAPPGYAYRSIGVALSRDGIRWEKYAGNPVIAPSRNIKSDEFDNVHCHMPTVLYRPNHKPRYQMWYSGYRNNDGNRIGYAHSDDGLKWVRSPQPVLGYGKPGAFDDRGLRCPDVITHPQTGDYWMYYYGTRSGEHYGPTGLALSKDGVHWERRGKLSEGEERLLDGAVVYDPSAKLFRMWHDKGPAITYAVSRDGIRWQDLDGPPLIQPGKQPYDRGYCQAPSVLYDAKSQAYFVYYNGSNRNDDQERVTINLAIFPAAELAKLRLLPAHAPPHGQGKETALNIGNAKRLTWDESLFSSHKGIRWQMHAPKRTGEKNIIAKEPWESWQIGGGHKLLKEKDRWRIWYTVSHGIRNGEEYAVAYAESRDGIHWVKPELGLVEYAGSKKNNLVLGYNSAFGDVFVDPNAPAAERYRMAVAVYPHKKGDPPRYLTILSSPDGLRWSAPTHKVLPEGKAALDTQSQIFWDRQRNKYLLYSRLGPWRQIGRSEADTPFKFPAPVHVMKPENPVVEDYYQAGITVYEEAANAYLAFVPVFFHPGDAQGKPVGRNPAIEIPYNKSKFVVVAPDTVELHLFTSNDSIQWQRRGDHEPFIGLGPDGAFDSRQIYNGVGYGVVGDEIWLYYSGFDVTHTGGLREPQPFERRLGVISRAILRLDGFVSANAGNSGGELVTKPLIFTGKRLELNVDCGAGGHVDVELQTREGKPLPGFSLDDNDRVYHNNLRKTVTWKGNADLSRLTGTPVRLRLVMRNAKLYALQFSSKG